MEQIDHINMTVGEMKSGRDAWKRFSKTTQTKLNHVECIEETKENHLELVVLEKNYIYFLDLTNRIIGIYSELVRLAENNELKEAYFKKRIKEIQHVHKELHKEVNNKQFKVLEKKYIEGLRQAETINI